MEPARVEALLHKIWLAEFRINDLLGQVQPQRWKLSGVARDSFSRTLQALGSQLAELEKWRAQFEKRTDSVYLGYETYVAINAVLPRLDGVARSIAKYENSSLAAQYTQAGNQLFDLQQAVEPYLGFLLRNQDELFLAMQGNLAACQNQLGYAMRGRTQAAVPLKNVLPNFKGHPRLHRTKIILDWTEPAGATVQQPRKKRGGSKKFKVTLEEKETTGAPAPRKLQENKP